MHTPRERDSRARELTHWEAFALGATSCGMVTSAADRHWVACAVYAVLLVATLLVRAAGQVHRG